MSIEQEQEQNPLSNEEGQNFWAELQREDEGQDPPADVPPEEEPNEPAAAQPAAPAPKQPEPVDPRDIKPEYVSALERQVSELTGLVKSSVGRVGQLQSAVDKMVRAPTQQQVAAAMKSSEKWAALQRDFPDFAEAVEERVASLQAQPGIAPDEILRQAREFAEVKVNETHIRTAKTLASLVEPGWEQVSGSKEFHAWLESQPAEVFARAAKASAEWDAATVISLIRDFKGTSPEGAPQRGSGTGSRQRLASAAVPTGVTGARAVKADDLDGEQYWNHLAKQEARQRA